MSMLIGLLFAFNLSLAACKTPVTYLKVNQPSPCTGYLFTPEMELKVRQDLIEYDYLKKQNEINLKKINNLDEQIKIMDQIIHTQDKRIIGLNESRKWERSIYFVLGILAAGAAVYVAR